MFPAPILRSLPSAPPPPGAVLPGVRSRAPGHQKAVALREHGVYLIPGGLGGIGLTLAESIAKSVPARLVLLNRRDFPARESWDEWLRTHGDRDPIARQIRKIRTIEDAGAEV